MSDPLDMQGEPMTVRDLMAYLIQQDPDTPVYIGVLDDDFNRPGGIFLMAEVAQEIGDSIQIGAYADIAEWEGE